MAPGRERPGNGKAGGAAGGAEGGIEGGIEGGPFAWGNPDAVTGSLGLPQLVESPSRTPKSARRLRVDERVPLLRDIATTS